MREALQVLNRSPSPVPPEAGPAKIGGGPPWQERASTPNQSRSCGPLVLYGDRSKGTLEELIPPDFGGANLLLPRPNDLDRERAGEDKYLKLEDGKNDSSFDILEI